MTHQSSLQVRGSERIDFKRCELKWYWAWRKGLVPRAKTFGALDLGTWAHASLAAWYGQVRRQPKQLVAHMEHYAYQAITAAETEGAPEEVIAQAEELAALGVGMMRHYGQVYGRDPEIEIITVEVPLEFSFHFVESLLGEQGRTITVLHKLKPDAVFRLKGFDGVMLLETKTAATIRTAHIPIDDQARPYLAMAELTLKQAGVIGKHERLVGIMYNHLRKALPPDKPKNAEGKYLNKDGNVSARQPPPFFKRSPFFMSDRAKAFVLRRLEREIKTVAAKTVLLRRNPNAWKELDKTPHYSCPKFCQYFTMCALHDEGVDISAMRKSLYTQHDPYAYDEEHPTTDERASFELG